MIFFHGTSAQNAKLIEQEGFKTGLKSNWEIQPKKGFVYFSKAYAPFYASTCRNATNLKLALIKVEIAEDDLYPEDDFIFFALKKPVYTAEELAKISLENYKHLWKDSLKYLGNVATTPDKIKILGVTYFDGKRLYYKCDPVICPENYALMGDYYNKLSEWIFSGKDFMNFSMECD